MATPMYEAKTLDRVKRKFFQKYDLMHENSLQQRARASSIDSLYTGTRVRGIPEFSLQVMPRPTAGTSTDITDLDLQGSLEQLKLLEKPRLSQKARQRISVKSKKRRLTASKSSPTIERKQKGGKPPLTSRSMSPLETWSNEGGREGSRRDDETDTGPGIPFTSSKPPLPQSCPKFPPPILHITSSDSAEVLRPPLVPATTQAVQLRAPGELTRTRDSALSTDSGLGGEFPSHSDRDSSVSLSPLSLQVRENKTLTPGVVHRLQLPKNASGFDSLRIGTKHHRKSMLLSELCVVGVSLPADVAQGQKGRGCMLKCRFSPYTQIEHLRVAILKQFHEQFKIPVQQLSPLHLCHYVEEEDGWEWLEEDHALHSYQLPTECKLELKPLEPVYRDVRVVIPHLECSLSVEFDQFSTVADVLNQVLSMSEPPLDPSQGYSLYHVRLRTNLEVGESMVHYHLLPSDVLECRLSVGRMQTIILTVKIPSIQSSRKVKVCLDETVGELISTLMRRVPDPDSPRWAHMSLYLSAKDERGGTWLEDYKFLAAYKLKNTDALEFKPKYRPMVFELRVYPHDHGDQDRPYCSPELLVAQNTLVSEVVELLCNTASLEYDPRFYGLYLHDDSILPTTASMWDHLDAVAPGYQDSLVMHMLHKPIEVSFNQDPDSTFSLSVDFSQPCRVTRDILCRRYGVRHHQKCGLKYEGIRLNLAVSLHNQGVLEQEHVCLVRLEAEELISPLQDIQPFTSCSGAEGDKRQSTSSMIEDNTNIWEEDLESEKSIRYDKNGLVIGATLNKLVERITSTRDHGILEADLEFVKTFLFTYQAFTTPEKLFKKLLERYNVVCPEGMSLKEFGIVRQTIQARVINALRLWVDLSVDFKDNPALQDAVLHFVMTVLTVDHPKFCKPLRMNVLIIKGANVPQGVVQKKNLKTFREPLPPVKFPDTPSTVLSVFDFDPEEIARQMTIIDFSLFAMIKPSEMLNQAWQKPKYKSRAQNILRLVERMNNLTLWVATTILSQKDVHDRAKRITDFVQIGAHLHRLHNFCTLLSILNGLAHPSITRLKRSFGKLDKAIIRKMEELQQLARPGENFKLLREELKRASNPCIPYLGLYMSDLTFLDNGNPNFHSDGLINFSKCRLIYNQIRDLILRQDKPFNFEEVPALQDSLKKFHFLDSDVLYDVSSTREQK